MNRLLIALALVAVAAQLGACADPQREALRWECYGHNTNPRVTTQNGIEDNVPYHDCKPTPTYERPQRMEGR